MIFDPAKIEDKATFGDPLAPPAGIDLVMIGGKTAMQNGEIKNGRLGRSVRRF